MDWVIFLTNFTDRFTLVFRLDLAKSPWISPAVAYLAWATFVTNFTDGFEPINSSGPVKSPCTSRAIASIMAWVTLLLT